MYRFKIYLKNLFDWISEIQYCNKTAIKLIFILNPFILNYFNHNYVFVELLLYSKTDIEKTQCFRLQCHCDASFVNSTISELIK